MNFHVENKTCKNNNSRKYLPMKIIYKKYFCSSHFISYLFKKKIRTKYKIDKNNNINEKLLIVFLKLKKITDKTVDEIKK